MAFIGNTNITQSFTPAIDYFSGNGSTTAFTLSRPVASVAQVQVTIDNVVQNPSTAFSVSGNTITFTSAPLSGTNNIYVYYTSPITQVISPGQNTVFPSSLSTTNALYWDTSGNVGIGVIPSAWSTSGKTLEIGYAGSSLWTGNSADFYMSNNAYYNGAWKYGVTKPAALYEQYQNFHLWSYAASGTAGTTATFTEAMRIDSSGNVGIGTTSPTQRLQVDSTGATSTVFSRNGGTNANTNVQFKNLTTSFYLGTNTSGNFAIKYNDPDLATSPNMVIDSSGKVGIGTSSPSTASSTTYLNLNAVNANLAIQNTGTSTGWISQQSDGLALAVESPYNIIFKTGVTYGTGPVTSGTERMRITSAGYLKASNNGTYPLGGINAHEVASSAADTAFFVTSSNATPYGALVYFSGAAPNGTGNNFLQCQDTSAQRANIRSNGGLANYSANNVNLSDAREKTNIELAGSYLDKICAIPVKTFNYIDQNMEEDGGLTLGVIAQDVEAVAPELVMESNWGTKEEPKERLSIYQTDLQYALMKCIQEQQTIINDLKTRIETLEGGK